MEGGADVGEGSDDEDDDEDDDDDDVEATERPWLWWWRVASSGNGRTVGTRGSFGMIIYYGTPVEFLHNFSMYVLVDFCSRHFVGTPTQTMMSAAPPSPNGPLGNRIMARYFRGTFH